ncbi:MAG: protein kinase [Bryobacteraceae bacterium]
MTPEQLQRVRELLRAAEALEGQERLDFLKNECGNNEKLRSEFERLLDQTTIAHTSTEPGEEAAGPGAEDRPEQISHYRIVEELGRGGMGVVYHAIDTRLDRSVALKFLPALRVGNSERKQRFVHEARAASSLNHPNIVTIHDFEEIDGATYIVMEYVRGKTLRERIRNGDLHFSEALPLAVQIADAVATAHAAGIVHRDLKPVNIMVTDRGLAKLLDFGLAKLTEGSILPAAFGASLTTEGVIIGTFDYMSPEQAQGKKVDGRSDIFSFGVVLYETFTGRHPFTAESNVGVLGGILEREPKPASELVPSMPREIDDILARCLRKNPDERVQRMDEVKAALEELQLRSQTGQWQPAPARRAVPWKRFAAGLVIAIAAFWGWWWRSASQREVARPSLLVRLTSDPGLTAFPALSADGRMICYASDRSGEGNLDLWVQQVGGGAAIRITSGEADDSEPDFSPDGSRIAFRSEREGGGVYVVPALGGSPQLIVPGGRGPRFSPDGKSILYWTGELGSGLVVGSARTFMVPAEGGRPQPVRPEFALALSALWMPDGKRVLFLGRLDAKLPAAQTLDWWIAPLEGGSPTPTQSLALFRSKNLAPRPGSAAIAPDALSREGDRILFSARRGDTTNLWQIPISPETGRLEGEPSHLTSGTGDEVHPATAPGIAVFSSQSVDVNIWSLPADANSGKATGTLQPLTSSLSFQGYPSISSDGGKMTFISAISGNWDVWLRDVATGTETALTQTPARELMPKISGDGERIAYWQWDTQTNPAAYTVSAQGGMAEKFCEPCGPPTHISTDGSKVLTESFNTTPNALLLADLAAGKHVRLIEASDWRNKIPYAGRFSPDGKWIVFHITTRVTNMRRIFVAPIGNYTARIPESEWIPITGEGRNLEAYWSPNGRVLYFLSDRDGFRCVWSQRLRAATKRPLGEAFPVRHFHQTSRSIAGVSGGAGAIGLSAASGRLVFSLGDLRGNIWALRAQSQE